jgi:hypothetical protein
MLELGFVLNDYILIIGRSGDTTLMKPNVDALPIAATPGAASNATVITKYTAALLDIEQIRWCIRNCVTVAVIADHF